MSLSVVIPAYNQRDALVACLDALSAETTDCEIIVINGPSTDGTSGMVQERTDVSVLIECSSRNVNIARNEGIRAATGDILVLLSPVAQVQPTWQEAIYSSIDRGADAVSGPTEPNQRTAPSIERIDQEDESAPINGDNLALTRGAITALDGFDEYLVVNGINDARNRLRSMGLQVMWHPEMSVRVAVDNADVTPRTNRLEPGHWVDEDDIDWGRVYRSRAYLMVKHSGLGVHSVGRILYHAGSDGIQSTVAVAKGNRRPSLWAGIGVDVAKNVFEGIREGRKARDADHTLARNPYGLSCGRSDSVVATIHDWRESE